MNRTHKWLTFGLVTVVELAAFGCGAHLARPLALKLEAPGAVSPSAAEVEEAFRDAGSDYWGNHRSTRPVLGAAEDNLALANDLLAVFGREGRDVLLEDNSIFVDFVDPWRVALLRKPGALVLSAFGIHRSDVVGVKWVLLTPCFRIRTEGADDDVLAPGGLAVFTPITSDDFIPNYGIPFVSTKRGFAIGFPAWHCTQWAGIDIAMPSVEKLSEMISELPDPWYEFRFDDSAVAKTWAAGLTKAPDLGVAVASDDRGFVVLRNPDDPQRILVVPLRLEVNSFPPKELTRIPSLEGRAFWMIRYRYVPAGEPRVVIVGP